MKKIIYILPFAMLWGCKKDNSHPPKFIPPNITSSVNFSIVNLNPDTYDSVHNLLSDHYAFSVKNAYYDTAYLNPNTGKWTGIDSIIFMNNGNFFINSIKDSTLLSMNARLYITFFPDTDKIIINHSYTYSSITNVGYAPWINIWRNFAAYTNDSMTAESYKYGSMFFNNDTITITDKYYAGDHLVISGTFSESSNSRLKTPYNGNTYLKTWYLKGTFSNIIWQFLN